MTWFRLMYLAALASQLAWNAAAADSAATIPEANISTLRPPPVLRASEPPDSGLILLPGGPPAALALKAAAPIPPIAKTAPLPSKLAGTASPLQPALLPAAGREVAVHCEKQIGHWKESDARQLLGEPRRHRPAYDEKNSVNGTIYAFQDPSNEYKELELDFDLSTGTLRTVFVYPPRLTWQECRRLWSGPVSSADAAQGRKFYSYTNRRMDVLVDPAGKVISLGWY